MRVVVAGGTGFVGRQLVQVLQAAGHGVQILTRNVDHARQVLVKAGVDPETVRFTRYQPLDPETWAAQLEGCDGVINLVGEPLAATRWTDAKKAEIRRSRIDGTLALVKAIGSLEQKPLVMVNSSAIGYYGPHGDEPLDETSPPGNDFLAQVCLDWEAAAQSVTQYGIRSVVIRTGLVLGLGGGVLAQMVPLFQNFMGGPLGSGEQWVSWIHQADLAELMDLALTQESFSGVLNGTSPQPQPMKTFCQLLGQVIGRPSWLPVPALTLELLLGEAAQVVLTGQRVLPVKAQALGFQFRYPSLKEALEQILVE